MRKGTQNSNIIQDNDIFYGISLGYDFCAEHEWGIQGIREKMGMPNKELGVEKRTISTGVDNVIFFQTNKNAILILSNGWNKPDSYEKCLNRELSLYGDKNLATAWSENDFGIHVCGSENIQLLNQLYNAFKNNDIVIASVSKQIPIFSNTSLCILIKSKLPEEVINNWFYEDKKTLDLNEYEESIGLKQLKQEKYKSIYSSEFNENKHKYWMALSPKWINYNNENPEVLEKSNTKFNIMYWVNYGDNDVYGWFTVEQIKQWLQTPGLKLKTLKN